MKTNKQNEGFIMILAMVTTVLVTGGAILIGTAVIDNVHRQGCGSSLNAWRSGDIYGDLGDADNTEALDQALRCQKSINDSVQTAKPVATLISSAGNLGGGYENLATVGVDRMMDLTDNLSNPEHKNPVRDALLPPAITALMDGNSEESKPSEESLPVNDEVVPELEVELEVELESEEDVKVEPVVQDLPEVIEEEIEEVVVEEMVEEIEEEEEPVEEVVEVEEISYVGSHNANFSRPSTNVTEDQGIRAFTEETTSGSISVSFAADGSASCSTTLHTNFTTTLSVDGVPPVAGSGSAKSIQCSGDIDENGTFLLFGNIKGSVTISGQTVSNEGPITVTGYIASNGKMSGSISIDGIDDVGFQE